MMTEPTRASATVVPEVISLGEAPMVGEERWQEIHRLFREAQVPIMEIARRLELDRKTVRRCLRQARWEPYRRPPRRAGFGVTSPTAPSIWTGSGSSARWNSPCSGSSG